MSSATDSVTVTTLVSVDPGTAFEVFTDEVDSWWRRGPRYRHAAERPCTMCFEPRAGGRFLEVCDESGAALEVGRLLVWEPPERIVWESRAEGRPAGQQTEVEVRFEAVERGTRVTVEHRGWDRVPLEDPARHGLDSPAFASMMGTWWADLLVSHRRQAERRQPGREKEMGGAVSLH